MEMEEGGKTRKKWGINGNTSKEDHTREGWLSDVSHTVSSAAQP
jgi:hypothetical protein